MFGLKCLDRNDHYWNQPTVEHKQHNNVGLLKVVLVLPLAHSFCVLHICEFLMENNQSIHLSTSVYHDLSSTCSPPSHPQKNPTTSSLVLLMIFVSEIPQTSLCDIITNLTLTCIILFLHSHTVDFLQRLTSH